MIYPLFLTLHLFAALVFIRKQLPAKVMVLLEQGISRRARQLMPWVLLALFGAGAGMVWLRYWPLLVAPWQSSFGLLLGLKILLACSVLGHFLWAMWLFRSGRMNARYVHIIHTSVFLHMVAIVLLAKAMFYVAW